MTARGSDASAQCKSHWASDLGGYSTRRARWGQCRATLIISTVHSSHQAAVVSGYGAASLCIWSTVQRPSRPCEIIRWPLTAPLRGSPVHGGLVRVSSHFRLTGIPSRAVILM